jgi:hypothetical protein
VNSRCSPRPSRSASFVQPYPLWGRRLWQPYRGELFGRDLHWAAFFATVLFFMTEDHTLGTSDLINYARISQAEDTPGANKSSATLFKYVDKIRAAVLSKENPIVVIHAATGFGKSKVLPSLLQRTIRRPLLCLVTSTVDVVYMFKCVTCTACLRMGNNRRGGADKRDSQIVFATVGLVLRWYACFGIDFLRC